MASQLEAQTTYQQYSQLYQIAAQLNTQAQTDPSKAAEAQIASQQAHKAYAAYQSAWQKAYQDQKVASVAASQPVAAPAADPHASTTHALLQSLLNQAGGGRGGASQLSGHNPLAGLPGLTASTPAPAPSVPAFNAADLQQLFAQQIQQASMQAAAAAAQAATQQLMGTAAAHNPLMASHPQMPTPGGRSSLQSPGLGLPPLPGQSRGGVSGLLGQSPGGRERSTMSRDSSRSDDRPLDRFGANDRGGYRPRYQNRNTYDNQNGYNKPDFNSRGGMSRPSARDRLGQRPFGDHSINEPLSNLVHRGGDQDHDQNKDYGQLATDTVFVEGLPYSCDRKVIHDFFSQVGPLRSTQSQEQTGCGRMFLFMDENKQCNGSASISYQQPDDAENCISLLNGKGFPVERDSYKKRDSHGNGDDLIDQEHSAMKSPGSLIGRSSDDEDGGAYKRRSTLNDHFNSDDEGRHGSSLVNDPTRSRTVQISSSRKMQKLTEEMLVRPWLKFDDRSFWVLVGKLQIRMATLGERDPIGERRQKMGLPHQHNFAAKVAARGMPRGGMHRGGYVSRHDNDDYRSPSQGSTFDQRGAYRPRGFRGGGFRGRGGYVSRGGGGPRGRGGYVTRDGTREDGDSQGGKWQDNPSFARDNARGPY